MIIPDTGIGNVEIHLGDLDSIMKSVGFVRWAWDYNHATYDYKLEEKGTRYFVRIEANAVEGKLEDPDTLLRLEEPVIAKHLFPHGLDYEAPVSDSLLQAAKRKLAQVKEKLGQHQ